LAAIISKAISAKENNLKSIEMWGDGTPKREFTHVTDFADWIFNSSLFLERLPFILNTGVGVLFKNDVYWVIKAETFT
jgi:GDP-L-fucose synthase